MYHSYIKLSKRFIAYCNKIHKTYYRLRIIMVEEINFDLLTKRLFDTKRVNNFIPIGIV